MSDINRAFALQIIKSNPHTRAIFDEMAEALKAVYANTPYHGDCRFCGALWAHSPDHFEGCVIASVERILRDAGVEL